MRGGILLPGFLNLVHSVLFFCSSLLLSVFFFLCFSLSEFGLFTFAARREDFNLFFFFLIIYIYLEDLGFFLKKKKLLFCHVAHIWQPRQRLTDQWMENVTVV